MKRQQQEREKMWAWGVLLSFLLSMQAWGWGLAAGNESDRSQPCPDCWWKLVGETLFNSISRHTKPKAEASHHKSYVQIKRVKRRNFRLKVKRHHQEWLDFLDAARARITGLLLWGQAWTSFRWVLSCPGTQQSVECMAKPARTCLITWLAFYSLM